MLNNNNNNNNKIIIDGLVNNASIKVKYNEKGESVILLALK